MQLGCDPVELESAMPLCRALVTALDGTTDRLRRVGRDAWRGPSAQRWWSEVHAPLLGQVSRCAVAMAALAFTLQEQADQQRRASLGPVATTRAATAHGPGTWVGRTTLLGGTALLGRTSGLGGTGSLGGRGAGLVTVVVVPGVGTTAADARELAAD
ncbi:MAG: hypothetical protein ACK4V6_15495, partial [Microthrixaceae bacterium]